MLLLLCQHTAGSTEFETVEIAECKARKVKVPRRIIHFANGETMEEYSTDEEEEEEEEEHVKQVVSVDTVGWVDYKGSVLFSDHDPDFKKRYFYEDFGCSFRHFKTTQLKRWLSVDILKTRS